MAADCHITCKDVTVQFGAAVPTLAGISLTFARGEFVGLIGPSGCGKSTLLRCVAGLQPLTAGSLQFGTVTTTRPQLAYVFQESTLLPWRSVVDNIALPLEIAGVPKAARRAAALSAMERGGLTREDDAHKRPAMLSGGMRMRVSLARAWVTRPEILLLDEPFAALDDISRQQLNEELLRLWQQQTCTTLFVTHNVSEAVFLSQRILVMSRRPGRILAEIPIPFPYPRRPEDRAEPEFARIVGEVSRRLREAAGG